MHIERGITVEKVQTPMSRGRAMFYIFVCALLWASGGVLIKYIDANSFVISGWRCAVALPLLLIAYPVKSLRFTKRVWLLASFLAATGILFVTATKLTTAANAIILQFCAPLFIILINYFMFKERVLRSDIIVSIVTIFGITLFFLDELAPGNMLGNILSVISGVTSAGFFVTMSRTTEDRPTIVIASQIETLLFCLPFMIIFPFQFTLKMTVAMIALGIFQKGFSMVIYAKASPHCSAMDAVLISVVEPLCNPLLVMLFYNEKPGKFALVGSIVVIVSVITWNIYKVRIAERQAV